MKFFTYHDGSKERVGVLSPDGTTVYPVSSFGLGYNTMIDLIKNMSKEEKQDLASRLACPQAAGISFQDATLLAPIPLPRDILAVGGVGNFAAHVEETCRMNGVEYVKPEYCCYFCKRVNRAVPPGGKICLHEGITSMLDYEIELAVVIGKECSRVTEKDAFDYVFGYTIVNDITARDIQKNLPQYGYAKGLDDTTPMGPCIVTADEIPDPHNLRLTLKVNGEMRQNSITNDLILGTSKNY